MARDGWVSPETAAVPSSTKKRMSSSAPQTNGFWSDGAPAAVALNTLAPASEGFMLNVKVATPPETAYVYHDPAASALTRPTKYSGTRYVLPETVTGWEDES